MHKERTYRRWVKSGDLATFEIKESQTDLLISADRMLVNQARESVLNHRASIQEYINKYPIFYTSLEPVEAARNAPRIVRVMVDAAKKAGTGPMAAIAGAIAEFVGRDLLQFSEEVIVENGGDIFIKTKVKRTLGIYAGESSPFTGRIRLGVDPDEKGLGLCASSGTVSHSLNFGRADAALIISEDTALADAVATAAGNIVKNKDCVEKGIDFAKSISGVKGVLILAGDKMGSWGDIRIV
jgi:uncharacterized protein